jgi:rhodanese-related sulfurtransferase
VAEEYLPIKVTLFGMKSMVQQLVTFVLHHWILCLAFLIIVGWLIKLEFGQEVRGIVLISPQQVVDALNRESAIVIDVRENQSFAKGHILGAINVPKSDLKQQSARLEVHKSKPVIVTDSTGQQLIAAATALRNMGFSNVKALRGGMASWQNANLPLDKNK